MVPTEYPFGVGAMGGLLLHWVFDGFPINRGFDCHGGIRGGGNQGGV